MKPFAPLAIAGLMLAVAPAYAAPAQNWAVDKGASKIGFASSFDGTAFSGGFQRWDAAIRFDPNNLAGSSVLVNIDVASAATGDSGRDSALPGADWFNAKASPKATFQSSSFKALGGGRYQAIGTLTIRGVSKPLTLPFSLAITGDTAKMNATVGVNRLAFGVGQGKWKTTGVVPNSVNVTIAVTAKKAK